MQAFDDGGLAGRTPNLLLARAHAFDAAKKLVGEDADYIQAAGRRGRIVLRYDSVPGGQGLHLSLNFGVPEGVSRRQSVRANGKELLASFELPVARTETREVSLPVESLRGDVLEVEIHSEDGQPPLLNWAELWGPTDSPKVCHLDLVRSSQAGPLGVLRDLRFRPLAGETVRLMDGANGLLLAEAVTGKDGGFALEGGALAGLQNRHSLFFEVAGYRVVGGGGLHPLDQLVFRVPEYRPLPGETERVLSLDGDWDCFDVSDCLPQDALPARAGAFRAPGQFLQQGFQPDDGSLYRIERTFVVPDGWKGQRQFLRLEGTHGSCRFFVNGEPVGAWDYPYVPAEFEISRFVLPGSKNRLAIEIDADTKSIPDRLASSSFYAHHNLAGLHRSVKIFSLPSLHLSRCFVRSSFHAQSGQGSLGLTLRLDQTASGAGQDTLVTASVLDEVGALLAEHASGPPAAPGSDMEIPLRVEKVLPWNAEKPVLYRLRVELRHGPKLLQRFEQAVGFLQIETQPGELLLNGQPLKLAGVNRHEIDPLTGRADTARHAEVDARLFKDANCNYVRTSHYPPCGEFLHACDRIGLYVECEAPYSWSRRGPEEDDPWFEGYFLAPTAAMVEYYHRHPSVILWSIANESGFPHDGPKRMPVNYAASTRQVKAADPARPTIFNNEWANDSGLCDVACIHYPPSDFSRRFVNPGESRPVLVDEYMHVQCYNVEELRVDPGIRQEWAHGVYRFGLNDRAPQWEEDSYWNGVASSDLYCGGAIWAGIDEVFVLPDGSETGYGPWGLIDGWRRRKPEWWLTHCMYSPLRIPVTGTVAVEERSGLLRLPVSNRFAFTNLGECVLTWRLGRHEERMAAPSVGPGGSGELTWRVPEAGREGGLVELEVQDKSGRLVCGRGFALAPAGEAPEILAEAPAIRNDEDRLLIEGEGFGMTLDMRAGKLEPRDGHYPLLALPRPHLSQVEEKMVFVPSAASYLELPASSRRNILDWCVWEDGEGVCLAWREEFEELDARMQWHMDRWGAGRVEYEVMWKGPQIHLREKGLRLDLMTGFERIAWSRRCPWGLYPRGHIGRRAGRVEAGGATARPAPQKPAREWQEEPSPMGSRDFRSTRFFFEWMQVEDALGNTLHVRGDGSGQIRACRVAEGVRLFISPEPGGRLAPGESFKGRVVFRCTPAS